MPQSCTERLNGSVRTYSMVNDVKNTIPRWRPHLRAWSGQIGRLYMSMPPPTESVAQWLSCPLDMAGSSLPVAGGQDGHCFPSPSDNDGHLDPKELLRQEIWGADTTFTSIRVSDIASPRQRPFHQPMKWCDSIWASDNRHTQGAFPLRHLVPYSENMGYTSNPKCFCFMQMCFHKFHKAEVKPFCFCFSFWFFFLFRL